MRLLEAIDDALLHAARVAHLHDVREQREHRAVERVVVGADGIVVSMNRRVEQHVGEKLHRRAGGRTQRERRVLAIEMLDRPVNRLLLRLLHVANRRRVAQHLLVDAQ
jgi:hypothetical protein